MKTRLLLKERFLLAEDRFAEFVVWSVPKPISGSKHFFRYRLAYVVNEICVLRYDNEAGKGDHKHIGDAEFAYDFTTPEKLLADFRQDIENWRPK
jgi:hypothetical protein